VNCCSHSESDLQYNGKGEGGGGPRGGGGGGSGPGYSEERTGVLHLPTKHALPADAHPFDYMMTDIVEANQFDPDGSYVRKWLPALARLPVKYIHKCATCTPPLASPPLVQEGLSLLGASRLVSTRRPCPHMPYTTQNMVKCTPCRCKRTADLALAFQCWGSDVTEFKLFWSVGGGGGGRGYQIDKQLPLICRFKGCTARTIQSTGPSRSFGCREGTRWDEDGSRNTAV